jgi:hypothetical protein
MPAFSASRRGQHPANRDASSRRTHRVWAHRSLADLPRRHARRRARRVRRRRDARAWRPLGPCAPRMAGGLAQSLNEGMTMMITSTIAKNRWRRSTVIGELLITVALVSTACGGSPTSSGSTAATATTLPAPTATTLPAPTATTLPAPTATTLQPVVYVEGTVHFAGARRDPFVTSIELLSTTGDFHNAVTVKTGTNGKYVVSGIGPGKYNLWVLINTAAKMIPKCTDVIFPDHTWIAGIKDDQYTAITTETTSLRKAIDASIAFGSSGWRTSETGSSTATGVFAVSPVVELVQGKTMELDIVLTCK